MTDAATREKRFPTTQWSIVLACARTGVLTDVARHSLEQLCQTYWRPIYVFIRQRGYSTHDAEDLTQDFFATVLKGELLRRADPNRGRFRSLLKKALQDFLADASDKRDRQKRGGRIEFIQWDEWTAEAPSHLSIPAQAVKARSPEELFDLRWAATVVEQALRRLREECESKCRLRLFETLSRYLASERADVSYQQVAAELGTTEAAVKRQLHNLRRRYRYLLHETVAQTVDKPSEVHDEIRHLCAVLASVAE